MKRSVRGQSLVEMAFVLPFLVLMTIGAMEVGYYVYTYSELENATRRASEWASRTPPFTVLTCDDLPTPACSPAKATDQCAIMIKQNAIDGTFLSDLQFNHITITYPSLPTQSERQIGDLVQVQTTYQGQWLSPIGQRFFGPVLKFSFTSRRTILSTEPPQNRNPDCT
jgi:hypothetical protein